MGKLFDGPREGLESAVAQVKGGDVSLESQIKRISLKDTDLLLVKDPKLAEAIASIPMSTFPDGRQIYILFVENLDDVRALSASEMQEAGWVRDPFAKITGMLGE